MDKTFKTDRIFTLMITAPNGQTDELDLTREAAWKFVRDELRCLNGEQQLATIDRLEKTEVAIVTSTRKWALSGEAEPMRMVHEFLSAMIAVGEALGIGLFKWPFPEARDYACHLLQAFVLPETKAERLVVN